MNQKDNFKECKMEVARDNVIEQIKQMINEYKIMRDKDSMQKLAVLIKDRDKIYSNDEETINKYLNKGD